MIKHSLKSKIIWPSVIILTFLGIFFTAYYLNEFTRFTSSMARENISITARHLDSFLKQCERDSTSAAVSVSRFPDVIKAIKERDTQELLRILIPLTGLFEVTYFTITDENGIALARTHEPSRFGDSVLYIHNIEDALEGKVSMYYESGPLILVSIHTGTPVYDEDGILIGALSTGVRLDDNESLDMLKTLFGAEFSVFLGDTRIATTLIKDGKRLEGVSGNSDILNSVIENKQSYFAETVIFGEPYSTFWQPFINSQDKVFAVLAVGVSNAELERVTHGIVISSILIGLLGLVVSLVVLMFIITRITKPINELAVLVSDVTQGNVKLDAGRKDVSNDEIGSLISDVYVLIDAYKQVKDYENQLRETAQKSESASVAKSAFIANMSHEIRTPMNSIIGFNELAMDDDITPKTRDYLEKIQLNSEWLLQIINDVLDISKVESGKLELEHIPFDLHDIFAYCRTVIMPKAIEKGIILHFYAEPSVGKKMMGDPTRLRQILTNLLSNAVKFTNTGYIKLTSTIENSTDNQITVNIEVRDSGIGMTAEQISRIFEPYMQADSSTSRKYGGTGLGLSISKSLIELMGGKLAIESIPDAGSRFSFSVVFDTIDIPYELPRHESVPVILEKPVFEGEILVCEDNSMNQLVIKESLARIGLKTVIAENGLEGVNTVRKRIEENGKLFDLIFMDIQMPVMDGLEAASQIIKFQTGIPIIAMTANIMSGEKDIYELSGIPDFISKPFTSQELWRCLMKYLTPVNQTVEENTQTGEIDFDLEFKKVLQQHFFKKNQNIYNEIISAIETDNLELAYRIAHTMKGNAAQLGRSGLQAAAGDVERQLKEGKMLVTEDQLKTLETEIAKFLKDLSLIYNESINV
jgi:signal transduction histidine kinase/DNA-binding response OmpR family regulator